MNDPLWLGIDLGTQSVRAIVSNDAGQILATSAHPLTGRRSGREHTQSPELWWSAVCACCREVAAIVPSQQIAAIAVDATSGTVLLTDASLQPASEALMYDDSRAQAEAAEVQSRGRALWSELGYAMQPSWALPKLLWLRRQHASGEKDLRLTHQNDFIHQRLAGHRLSTDTSHALKSGYDLDRNTWPFDLLEELGLAASLFPAASAPGLPIGTVCSAAAAETGLSIGTTIISGMTDGCAAQLASGAVDEGSWNSVLGTTLVIKGVTAKRLHDPLGVVYSHLSADAKWLPGGASSTGAGLIADRFNQADLGALSAAAEQRGPTSLITYPLASRGERFPFFAPEAVGFSAREPTDATEHFRSILEGVAFMERLSLDYLGLLGAPLAGSLSISGGATRNPLWNQIRADVLGRTLTIPAVTEAAFGMCVLSASHRDSITASARRMVQAGSIVEASGRFRESYQLLFAGFVDALADQGWLPEALASFSLRRLTLP